MYVDKKLGGVSAVQTLSRLNRSMKGKNETMVLDFVNEADDILESFQPYFQTTFIEEGSDPNKLYDIQRRIDEYEVFAKEDVNDFANIFFNPGKPNELLQPVLDRVVVVWNTKTEDEKEDFRSLIQAFVRLYGFLSQVISFTDVELEKLYVFLKSLNRKLPKRKSVLPFEVLNAVDLDSFRIQKTYEGKLKLSKDDGELRIPSDSASGHQEEDKELLSVIVEELNKVYGVDLTEDDKVDMERMKEKINSDNELLKVMAAKNTPEAKKRKFEDTLDKIFLEYVHTRLDLYKKLTDPEVNQFIKARWYAGYREKVREREGGNI